MATPRSFPYCWVTWLTGLLAGENQCKHAPWFKAHFKYDKVGRTFELSTWKAQHDEMVAKRAAEFRALGYTVTLEDQNEFKLIGVSAILAGKADIVAVRDGQAIVSDCKGGQERDSDFWQVLVYLYALPKYYAKKYPNVRWSGEIYYRSGPKPVDASYLTSETIKRIGELMRVVGEEASPGTVPSRRECNFCDIGADDCSSKVIETEAEVVAVSDF